MSLVMYIEAISGLLVVGVVGVVVAVVALGKVSISC